MNFETLKKGYWPYIMPFLTFMVLTYAGSWLPYGQWVYPIKTILVGAVLVCYRREYPELATLKWSWPAIAVGVIVFVVWVVPEGWYPQIGYSEFNPYSYGGGGTAMVLIGFRLAGAVLVVPIFEELFWRSFALRWLIDEDFHRVPIGAFTWFSCVVIILGFGFEHHRWLVGLLAGVGYHALLYATKDLWACVLAHAVTNLLLGIYVLQTQHWSFW